MYFLPILYALYIKLSHHTPRQWANLAHETEYKITSTEATYTLNSTFGSSSSVSNGSRIVTLGSQSEWKGLPFFILTILDLFAWTIKTLLSLSLRIPFSHKQLHGVIFCHWSDIMHVPPHCLPLCQSQSGGYLIYDLLELGAIEVPSSYHSRSCEHVELVCEL